MLGNAPEGYQRPYKQHLKGLRGLLTKAKRIGELFGN
jgi:hypothetical protein